MSDSEAEKKRRGLRRGQRQDVNYCEVSDSSDSRASAKRRKVKLLRRHRKEHLSSDFSDGSSQAASSTNAPTFSLLSAYFCDLSNFSASLIQRCFQFTFGTTVGSTFFSSSSLQALQIFHQGLKMLIIIP